MKNKKMKKSLLYKIGMVVAYVLPWMVVIYMYNNIDSFNEFCNIIYMVTFNK